MANLAVTSPVSLDDKWTRNTGRIVINGSQVIAKILMEQAALDRAAGLNTAGYITGYRGSPLGNVDTTLWSIKERLAEANIVFQPGVNEDIAATAVRGTQQIEALPGARYDGVFSAWYGKGPGVDRSGDAFKHGNCAGTHKHGGVLLFYGDDHAGKSSTVSHQSEQAVASSLIPSLYPANAEELLMFGLLGIALSRYSGCWIGIKCVNDAAEQTATIDIDLPAFKPVLPEYPAGVEEQIHIRSGLFNPLGEEQIVIEHRLPLVHRFVRANGMDRTIFGRSDAPLGIVTTGKSFGDVRSALARLGIDAEVAERAGIALYKVGCIWPLEPEGLCAFARGKQVLLVVEEKKSFLEQQIAEILINDRARPRLLGKVDENGHPLLSSTLLLEPVGIAWVIAERLRILGIDIPEPAAAALPAAANSDDANAPLAKRAPYFCSGCPHNRSTRIPEGSFSMTGIGCHTMVNFVRPDIALLPTQMGGEGGNWIGLAPFTDTPHMFQNMGDGTYYHSGLLAIRAAVAARVNITYKILYNDAVAMTGGQPIDGPISVAEIVQQLRSEGVGKVVILSDNPAQHRSNPAIPSDIEIGHRDSLDAVQRELREIPGCTILIYEQTCAAEKRRRRKRGTFPNPPKRLFISKSVCEGCGDCSEQSTCVSLMPVETEFGRKRAIDQSSCNKDYSCLDGFCPSFVTVRGAEPRKPAAVAVDESLFADLPHPTVAPLAGSFGMMIAGIGGSGVVTVGALIGMAAHIEGHAMSLFDLTGLSQKNGAVFSHIKIARTPADILSQKIGREEADLLLAFDMLAALAPESAETLRAGHTRAIANCDVAPTVSFQFDRNFATDPAFLLARLKRATGQDRTTALDASALALSLLGDTIGTNLFLVGVAAQQGLLPVGIDAIEAAVRLNGVAVDFNLKALRLGRLFVAFPDRVTALAGTTANADAPATLDMLIAGREAHLRSYQGDALAARFRALVAKVQHAETAIRPGSETLTRAAAQNYAKLLAYKDEYEVARLLSDPAFHAEIRSSFEDGGRIAFNLAPPMLPGRGRDGRPKKREFGAWILPLFRLLATMRGLRGTMFDPFGYSAERRTERALIAQYEALVAMVVNDLDEQRFDAATRLLSLADGVRGYGPVKETAVERYRTELREATADFTNPAEQVAASPAPRPVTA